MSESPELKISVRGIVEYSMRGGDIIPGAAPTDAFAEGGKAHRAVQEDRGEFYQSEVSLVESVSGAWCTLVVHGRADGIDSSGSIETIEEIKSTSRSLQGIGEDDYPAHWAQAKLYGAMLSRRDDLSRVAIRLLYFHRPSGQNLQFQRVFERDDIEAHWESLVAPYLAWAETLSEYRRVRNSSIDALSFPFPSFRAGQKRMAERVFETIREGETLFLQAPTGIGKTIGVLYPAAKSLAYGHSDKIFYLTAKTVARSVAEQAVGQLERAGAKIKSVTITAKAKICFLRSEYPLQPPCDPAICRYARGHFDRVDDAIADVFSESIIDRDTIERYAEKHTVCPFEFSLDIANWADIVIGDYNYAFDPRVQLQRFFQQKGRYCLLIDEAHNLVDRGRDMFSATIDKRNVLNVRRLVRGGPAAGGAALGQAGSALPSEGRYRKIEERLGELNSVLLSLKKRVSEDRLAGMIDKTEWDGAHWVGEIEAPKELVPPATEYLREVESHARSGVPIPQEVLDLYFEIYSFLRVLEWYGESYLTLHRITRGGITSKLACIDPSSLIDQTLAKSRSAVFFSATLEPMAYFASLLAGTQQGSQVALDSPFPRDNLLLVIDPTISTRFRRRADSYDQIASRVESLVASRRGNYLVFFPSYSYADEVRPRFELLLRKSGTDNVDVISQMRGLSEDDRDSFLKNFSPTPSRSLVGFVVMGGIFAEGIDLVGERLSGAVVVGPGLPQIGPERDVIRHFFDDRGDHGFDYAYTYPGFNRVQQAAGRVIRTEEDRGVVLLIGDRFAHSNYQELFPPEWHPPILLNESVEFAALLTEFWS